MSEHLQLLIVGIVVAIAVIIAVGKLIRALRGKDNGCPSCSKAAGCPFSSTQTKRTTANNDSENCPHKNN